MDGEDRAEIAKDPRSNVQFTLVKASETVGTGEEKHSIANRAIGGANDDQTQRRVLSFVQNVLDELRNELLRQTVRIDMANARRNQRNDGSVGNGDLGGEEIVGEKSDGQKSEQDESVESTESQARETSTSHFVIAQDRARFGEEILFHQFHVHTSDIILRLLLPLLLTGCFEEKKFNGASTIRSHFLHSLSCFSASARRCWEERKCH